MAFDESGEFPCSSLLQTKCNGLHHGWVEGPQQQRDPSAEPIRSDKVGSRILLHVTIANVDRKVLAFNEDSNYTRETSPGRGLPVLC